MNKLKRGTGDWLEAKINMEDYMKNRSKQFWFEAVSPQEKNVECRVDAETLELAKQLFLRKFLNHKITKITRMHSYLDKKGGFDVI